MYKWLPAIRPHTLIASLSPVMLCYVLAGAPCPSILFLMIVLTALSIQILCNLANDFFDHRKGADTVERKGPVRVCAAGLVSERAMLCALGIVTTSTLLFGSYLIYYGGWIFALLLALAILCAYLYTAGPFSLAYLGLGDLFVFVFFGPVATAAPYYLLTKAWHVAPCILGLIPGALSTTLLVMNNLRDESEDRTTKKNTLVVRWGSTWGKVEATICLLIPLTFPLCLLSTHPRAWIFPLVMLLPTAHLALSIRHAHDPLTYNKLLGHAARLLYLSTASYYAAF